MGLGAVLVVFFVEDRPHFTLGGLWAEWVVTGVVLGAGGPPVWVEKLLGEWSVLLMECPFPRLGPIVRSVC